MQLVKVFVTCKNYRCFQRKIPKCKYWVLKVSALRPKWCVLAGSKMTHSVCVCSHHRNVVLLVDAMDWDLTYKDLIKMIVCNTESNKCILHWCESCPSIATLKYFFYQDFNEYEEDEKFNYCQWDTTDWAILTIFTATYQEYKETLIVVIDNLKTHSHIAKLKITRSW